VSLPAGESCTVSITFTPTAGGPRIGTLTVGSDADAGDLTAALDGTGITALALSKTTVSFGEQQIDSTSAAQIVTLTNEGSEVVTGLTISVNGQSQQSSAPTLRALFAPSSLLINSSSPFQQTNTCQASLNPGESCTVSVTFAPTIEGVQTSTLSIASSASLIPQTVALSGTGTIPQVTTTYVLHLPVVVH
jgi:archaellum component FlaF (FlaF/FlaG flagellin family)